MKAPNFNIKFDIKDHWKFLASVSMGGLILSLIAVLFLLGQLSEKNDAINHQNSIIQELISQQATSEQTISEYKKELQSEKNQAEALEKRCAEVEEKAKSDHEKAIFLDDYIVIVGADRTFFHRNFCHLIESSTFWAFNIDAAFEMGFKPCRYCMY